MRVLDSWVNVSYNTVDVVMRCPNAVVLWYSISFGKLISVFSMTLVYGNDMNIIIRKTLWRTWNSAQLIPSIFTWEILRLGPKFLVNGSWVGPVGFIIVSSCALAGRSKDCPTAFSASAFSVTQDAHMVFYYGRELARQPHILHIHLMYIILYLFIFKFPSL